MLKEYEKMLGSQKPTFTNDIDTFPSLLDVVPQVNNFFALSGINLLPWQKYVLSCSLRRGETIDNNTWQYQSLGLSLPRQNGKSEILIARIVLGMIVLQDNIYYSSYREYSAIAIFERTVELIKRSKFLSEFFPNLPSGKGKILKLEAVNSKGEKLGSCVFATRGGAGTGRGLSCGVIMFDEANELKQDEHESILAISSTFRNKQVYYYGTPETVERTGVVKRGMHAKKAQQPSIFRDIRRNMKASVTGNSLWIEWSADKLADVSDVDMWFRTNPTLNYDLGEGRMFL